MKLKEMSTCNERRDPGKGLELGLLIQHQ
jgi:hypothetical protein